MPIDLNDADKQPTGFINTPLPSNDGDTVSQPKRQIVDDVGAYRWLQPNPIYCDHYTASSSTDGSIIRVSFGEYIGREYYPIYRTAVAMPLSEAKRLVRTLTRLIGEAEKEAEEALAAKAAPRESE
jgi:hypothetical protein